MKHKYSLDIDGCVCGGHVVYFEDGDKHNLRGEGCEVANVVFKREETIVRTLEQELEGEEYLEQINNGYPPLSVWLAFWADVKKVG